MNERTRNPGAETYAEPDLVGQYLTEIGATRLLTAAEEVDLAQRIEAGLYAAHLLENSAAGRDDLHGYRRRDLEAMARDGELAKDHLTRANLRLVVAAARKYTHRGMPFLDVIQEGNLGLIRAVEKFDYAKGFKFSTYAMWWIRQAIERGLAQQLRTVRLPVDVVEKLSRLRRVERELRLRLGQEPSVDELAEAAAMTVERVEELRRLGRDPISLDSAIDDEGRTVVGDLIEDTETPQAVELVEHQALADELRALVDTLPPREALIISMRYGLEDGHEYSLREVGERVGLTRERVRQLEKESLAKLRDPDRNQQLLAWAG